MLSTRVLILLTVSFVLSAHAYTVPEEVKFGAILPFGVNYSSAEATVSFKLAMAQINNDSSILPGTKLTSVDRSSMYIPSTSLRHILQLEELGLEIIYCCYTSGEVSYTTPATSIFQMIQLSYFTNSDYLTADHDSYPYFARITPIYAYQADAVFGLLGYLAEESGQQQYLEIGILVYTRPNGIAGARALIDKAPEYDAHVLAYQQFISVLDTVGLTQNFTFEIEQLKKSGARVFVAIMPPSDFLIIMNISTQLEIVGDSYIWICFDGCALPASFGYNATSGGVNQLIYNASVGMLGINQVAYKGEKYAELVDTLTAMGTAAAPYNKSPPTIPFQYIYDGVFFLAQVIQKVIEADGFTKDGKIKDKTMFYEILTSTFHTGVTGEIALSAVGDRTPIYDLVNLQPNNTYFTIIGDWSLENGAVITEDIVFRTNSTEIPDIDIRPPFAYWDCEKKERDVDLTGKTITLKKPGGSNPRYIDYDYYCDQFIDCENLSDESVDGCKSNYTILFIVYGVITFVLILIAILFFITTILFGCIFRRKRFISASPLFLLLIVISCIVGYCSIFAWYGKPQNVACGFQPWLLGLAVNSMIAALCAKTFRIWRIFKSPFNRKVITDFELLLLWALIMLPGVIILALWTLISTPTARLEKLDGAEHYVCDTGGFTGPPGGYVFFGIFVGYSAIVLCFGAFLSIVTRNVPALFNESKLISVSIYHLIFLSLVTIPVIIALKTLDPFIGWIIRTTAILYAFTATLWIQFLPKIVNLIIKDRCQANIKKDSTTKGLGDLDRTSTEGTFSQIPEAVSQDSSN